ncbi:diguanylate cyclase [Brevibacillus fluminis]|uniref:Diguanylate cyclase n=1 Tax=Brevibacillus fluminis TaxID=511487 RepID=A0A3M8DUU9_9BACL|nr:diguanylate cyclase [Brevibacillus fluminis]RNB91953.1 diguanylate cyclase [Brevibacillus fluminis]
MSRINQAQKKNKETLLMEGKRLFVSELKKQLQELERLARTFEQTEDMESALGIYRIVHTLKGSAPMFGYERIGLAAEALVHVWEWTQRDSEEERQFIRKQADQFIKKSSQLILGLSMEYDISRKEMELDETRPKASASKEFNHGRILLIDDDDVLRSYLMRRLSLDHYEIAEADGVESAKVLLWQQEYDLIILDLLMHPDSGYELFEFLKESPTLKWLPLIVLSGKEELEDKIRCFRLGADDYVTKPFHYEELEARINNLLMRTRHYEQMAFLDPLTGVYNRRYFDNQLTMEMERVRRNEGVLSLAFIDVDHFKRVNDTYGHHVGDLVLQGLTHTLNGRIRSTDLLARFGGEEFVILFPDTTGEDAQAILEELLGMIRQAPVATLEGESYSITFSAGAAQWQPEWSADEWIRHADEAMYRAKEQGRNQVVLSDGTQPLSTVDVEDHQGGRRKCVLLADDDAIIRSMVASRLRHLPLDIIEASDGESALDVLRNNVVDLCVLDGIMPKMDGYHLLEQMKQMPHLQKVKVLMLSGRKHEDDVIRGLMLGADDYMSKPFSLVELEIRAKRLLEI